MRRLWQNLFDEPLIPFAIIGGILFVVYGLRRPKDNAESIEIGPATIRALEQSQQELLGRSLTEEERQNVIAGYVDDEVLIREAFRLDLEKRDSRVRKRLLDVMRSTLDQPVAAPTRAELEAYFRENRERFEVDEVVTLEQVFFAFGSDNQPEDPDELLKTLRAGTEHTELGDETMLGRVLRERSQNQLQRSLGGQFAQQVFSLPMNEWQGPLESRSGTHFVRVIAKQKPPPPSFETMEEYLRQDWMFRRRRAVQDEKIAELSQRYRIVFLDE